MHADLLLFLFVVVFGCAAFIFGIFFVICRMIAGLGRSIFRLVGGEPRRRRPAGSLFRSQARICPQPGCGKAELRPARYCSQCGARMPSSGVVGR